MRSSASDTGYREDSLVKSQVTFTYETKYNTLRHGEVLKDSLYISWLAILENENPMLACLGPVVQLLRVRSHSE